MLWAWCGGHPEWSDGEWVKFLGDLQENGLDGVLLGGGPAEVGRVSKIATAAGLVVHAWMWTFCRPQDEVAAQKPEWFQVSGEGKNCLEHPPYVGYYKWLCPSNVEAVQHIAADADKLAAIEGVEAVHLDYVRFPDVILAKTLQPKYGIVQDREYPQWDFCYCDLCVDGFRGVSGVDVRQVDDPAAVSDWKLYRHSLVRAAVDRVRHVVAAHGKVVSAAVFPYPDLARQICRQSWDEFPGVDAFFPMVYHNFYGEEVEWIKFATAQGRAALQQRDSTSKMYVGLYLPELQDEATTRKAMEAAKAGGADGVSLFDAENLKEFHIRALCVAKKWD